MTRPRPILLDDWFVITLPPVDSPGLAAVAPAERRNPSEAPSVTPTTSEGRTGPSGDRCRYGWRTTCTDCGPFNACRPGRLQRFLERRSLLGLMWGQR